MVKGFSKMYNFSFFGKIFCKHFYFITRFCDKKFNFCKFASFFADSKSRAQELSNDVSFVIFGHQTRNLEGRGGQIDPPSISWFSSTPAEIGLIKKLAEVPGVARGIFFFKLFTLSISIFNFCLHPKINEKSSYKHKNIKKLYIFCSCFPDLQI